MPDVLSAITSPLVADLIGGLDPKRDEVCRGLRQAFVGLLVAQYVPATSPNWEKAWSGELVCGRKYFCLKYA